VNFDAPPRRSGLKVLLIVLGGLALLFLGILFGGYYLLMHTAVPLRMFGAMLTSGANPENIKIDGISGSISKGFRIQKIRWGKAETGASEIRDVRLAYNNFWDLMGGRRVVFREIRIGSAHLDLTGSEKLFSQIADNSADESDQSSDDVDPTNAVVWTNSSRVSRHAPPRQRPGLVQIDRVSVEDVFITNRANGFSLSIPTIEWTGFKSLNGKVELGDLKIESDRLKVTTLPGEEMELQGKKKKFDKKLEGTVLPRLHAAIRQPIAFTVDVRHDGTSLAWRLKAFDGKLEADRFEDGSESLKCQDLDLAAYIDAPLPQHLSLEATLSGSTDLKDGVRKGSFTLGRKTFTIEPLELEASGNTSKTNQAKTNQLAAVCRSGNSEFTYRVIIPDQVWKAEQRLAATPAMTPEETLAQVFYEKSFVQLSEQEQQAVKKMMGCFGGWIPAETNSVQ